MTLLDFLMTLVFVAVMTTAAGWLAILLDRLLRATLDRREQR